MPRASEQRDQRHARLRGRIALSRAELFALAHTVNGDQAGPDTAAAEEQRASFPHSHTMRVLLGRPGQLLLAGAAVAMALLRPQLLWRAMRFTPMLRPLLLRYLLPLLGGH